jgi:glycine/D-amino acid oxidase-like deaminating enzyme
MPDDALPSSADVVVVGAGLAGLTVARALAGASVDVLLFEAADAPGGRVRTDRQDGLLLDRGFQLLNPSYPEVRRQLDLRALHLRPFRAGLVVSLGGDRQLLGDPRRWPAGAISALTAPVGSPREKLALARWAIEVGFGRTGRIKSAADTSLDEELHRRRLGVLGEQVLRPFLAGVLADWELETSRRFGELLLRSFVRGTPALPAGGMRAIPDQLASDLPPGVLHCETAVRDVHDGTVATDRGTVQTRLIVLAADPRTSCRLAGLPTPALRGLTTHYHRADTPPTELPLLHVDGEHRGPVVNTAVISAVAPTYAESGALIASTVLGADTSSEPAARAHAGLIYGVDPRAWEHVATYAIPEALPAVTVGQPLRSSVHVRDGLFVAGDHRDTASIQGAMVSGRRAAEAVLATLRHRIVQL